ncbi:hypothetical protein [Chryseolinea lacunae]|uniref:Lipocalin-like domain-containing protein n=1 Tax=Chryseolinea lacunae TaxID=2801331 RepID=A0ABS1KYF9_9BACT|nr:hypothetical protein [Chryseolinea lacunae]MBL0744480.1 hypothetical protein [Chryseolinea lacunae]
MKHLINFFFIANLAVISFSCEQKTVVKHLTYNSQKYWNLVYEHPLKIGKGLLIKDDGTYEVFYEKKNGVRLKYVTKYLPKWSLLNDSTFHFVGQNVKYKIEYLNEDILILNNLSARQLIIYKVSKDQISSLTPDTSDHSYDL